MYDVWDKDWWLSEVEQDPAYQEELIPLVIDLLQPKPELLYLDLGCGEGQLMRTLAAEGWRAVGCDLSRPLLGRALFAGPVVQARLPSLDWLRPVTVDGVGLMVVLEHIADHRMLVAGALRVTKPGGVFVVVSNHPAFTAPGAGPLIDPGDGEVTWRWGRYLEPGTSVEPAGSFNLTMHHRPLGELLSAAATEGWVLDDLVERGPGEAARKRDPLLAAQANIPRLLGLRFHKAP